MGKSTGISIQGRIKNLKVEGNQSIGTDEGVVADVESENAEIGDNLHVGRAAPRRPWWQNPWLMGIGTAVIAGLILAGIAAALG